jgi:hypothetical protein
MHSGTKAMDDSIPVLKITTEEQKNNNMLLTARHNKEKEHSCFNAESVADIM